MAKDRHREAILKISAMVNERNNIHILTYQLVNAKRINNAQDS